MAYTKQTWQTGDVVTAAKLNNIENGISRLPYSDYEIIRFTYEDPEDESSPIVCDHTVAEIEDIFYSGSGLLIGVYCGVILECKTETLFQCTAVSDLDEPNHLFRINQLTLNYDGTKWIKTVNSASILYTSDD